MATPLSIEVLVCAAIIYLVTLAGFALYPVVMLSFQVGTLVGLLMHSSYSNWSHQLPSDQKT